MKFSIPSGTTSKRIPIFIQDSSTTVGAGLSGLAFNTSGLICYSWIDTDGNAGGTVQALQTATLGTWTTRGFVEKDATHMKGDYEFGIPDALLAAGVKWAHIYFSGATNMAPCVLEIEVTANSNQDGVRGGMTALPNAAANAAGGLPISTAGGLDLDEMNVDIEAIQTSTAGLTFTVSNQVDANVITKTGFALTAAYDPSKTASQAGDAMALTAGERNSTADAIFVRAMVESYAALHAAPTLAQALFEVRSLLSEFGIAGTTITTKKLDGSTTATTATLDDATTPTSRTRAT